MPRRCIWGVMIQQRRLVQRLCSLLECRCPGHNAHFNALTAQIHLLFRDKMRIGMIPILIMMRQNTSLRYAQCGYLFARIFNSGHEKGL